MKYHFFGIGFQLNLLSAFYDNIVANFFNCLVHLWMIKWKVVYFVHFEWGHGHVINNLFFLFEILLTSGTKCHISGTQCRFILYQNAGLNDLHMFQVNMKSRLLDNYSTPFPQVTHKCFCDEVL